MAITSVGFKGTVGQSEDARRWGRMGPRFTVGGPTELQCSHVPGVDRRVQVAVGTAEAGAVLATSDGVAYVDLPANGGSQTRYDLIVQRFVWTDPITQPVLTYVKGIDGSGALNLAALVRTLGTQYDGVLAVVRVAPGQGALTANDIFDARVWGGIAGPLLAAQSQQLTAVDGRSGQELLSLFDSTTWVHSGSTWVQRKRGPVITNTPVDGNPAAMGQGDLRGLHAGVNISQPLGPGRSFLLSIKVFGDVLVQANSEARLSVNADPDAGGKFGRAQNKNSVATSLPCFTEGVLDSGTSDSIYFQPVWKAQTGTITPTGDPRLCYSVYEVIPK